MITGGAIFDNFKFQVTKNAHWIVEITDGTTTWLLSHDLDLDLDEGHVYPLLIKEPVIKEKVDFVTKKWSVSDLSISITNLPYHHDDIVNTLPKRISDEFNTPLVGQTIKAYYLIGRSATQLSDGLLRFEGTVLVHPDYTESVVNLKAADKGRTLHKTLPRTTVKEELTANGLWFDYYVNADQAVPLVWGDFTYDPNERTGRGLAKGIMYSSSAYLVSSRELHSLTESWFDMKVFDDLCEYISPTFDTAYQGYLGFVNPTTNSQAHTFIKPIGVTTKGTYNFGPFGALTWDPDEVNNILDYDNSNYMTFTDTWDSVFGPQHGYQIWEFPDYAGGSGLSNSNGIGILNDADSYIDVIMDDVSAHVGQTQWAYWVMSRLTSGDLFQPGRRQLGFDVPSSTTTITSLDFNCTDSFSYGTNWATDIGWHLETGMDNQEVDTNKTLLVLESYNPDGGDNIWNNDDLTNSYVVRVRLAFLPYWQNIDNYYAVCKGFKYGTWIDSRSSNYSSSDLIEDPVGIVEDILRNELDYVTADIDTASFDAAENISMKHKINIGEDEKIKSDDLIKKICEQSPFAFYVSGAGKARLIDLNDGSPTTNVIIPWSHIKENSLKIGRHKWIINKIESKYRYHQERKEYMSESEVHNNSSITDYGERLYSANWDYIADDTSRQIMERNLISVGYQSLWATPKTIISFNTFTGYANLEVGDWVELDSTTVDPQILVHGESWNGKQFIIDSISVSTSGVHITAIQLSS